MFLRIACSTFICVVSAVHTAHHTLLQIVIPIPITALDAERPGRATSRDNDLNSRHYLVPNLAITGQVALHSVQIAQMTISHRPSTTPLLHSIGLTTP